MKSQIKIEYGKPVKSFEVWMETVADIDVVNENPKATPLEA